MTANNWGRRPEFGQLSYPALVRMAAAMEVSPAEFTRMRRMLNAVVKRGQETGRRVSGKVAKGADVFEKCVRHHPYPSIAFCVGIGAVIGILGAFFLR